MIRTTEKYTDYDEYMSNVPEKAHHAINFVIYEELYKLENIEEELGIDFITLFKALKEKIYSIHPKTQKICLIIVKHLYYCGKQWLIGCLSMEWNDEENSCDSWDCYLKDYGKTWALTKEELESDENAK